MWTAPSCDSSQRSPYGKSLPGAGAVHHIKNPRAVAGRLRRAQTFLRAVGIEITFSRDGRLGTRMIRVSTKVENCVSSVSIVGANPALMALTEISLALLGSQNQQQLLRTMLTVLTQAAPSDPA
jgi:hypothetical protein